jgi:hypothetical protein
MQQNDRESQEIGRFLDEIAAGTGIKTATDMKAYLLAFSKIRLVLSLLESKGIQVLAPNSVERYEENLSKKSSTKPTLDFVLRKENVEIQIEIKYQQTKDISLRIRDLQHYYEVLSNNSKTEEIMVTWVVEGFPTLTLDLAQLQKYLLREKQLITIEIASLKPLFEAVTSAFDRHMPDLYKTVGIESVKGARVDPRQLFVESLFVNTEKIKAAGEARRSEDRRRVSESITNQDIKELEQIFDEVRVGRLTLDGIEEKLKQMASLNLDSEK